MSKRILIPALFIVVLVAAWFYLPGRSPAQSSPSPCGTLSTQTVTSPSGAWNAVMSENYCSYGALWTDGNYDVSIVNVANPSINEQIFAVCDDGPIARPVFKWTSDSALKINTVPLHGLTKPGITSYQGIKITYIYRADNAPVPTSP